MRFKRLLLLLFVAWSALQFQACNEQPTDLGFLLLNDTSSVKTVCSEKLPLITSTGTEVSPIVIFNSGSVYIGKTDSITAVSMLRFQHIPDSLDGLAKDKISECYMELYPRPYAIGDTISNKLSFGVYKISKRWTNKTICDSLFDRNGNSDYFENVSQGHYDKPIPYKYKDKIEPIKIDLNKQLLLDWFEMAKKKIKDKTVINWGIAILSDENTDVLRQLSAQQVRKDNKHAEITMIYINKNNKPDTLKIDAAIEAAVICNIPPKTDDMIVQGATVSKGVMGIDISSIPRQAGILSAELELTLDTFLVKKGNMALDSLLNLSMYSDVYADSITSRIVTGYRVKKTNKFRFPNIVRIIEKINRNGGKAKLYIKPSPYSLMSRLDRMPFYGIKEKNADFRPKLRIVYSSGFVKK